MNVAKKQESFIPRILLAPMDGWTDWPLRQMIFENAYYKPDIFFTEFVHVESLIRNIYNNKKILFKLETDKNDSGSEIFEEHSPMIAQLYGNNPDSYYEATKILLKNGWTGIDINMGCSIKKIAERGDGAGLINEPDRAVNIIKAVKMAVEQYKREKVNRNVNITISVKTRLGFNEDIGNEWILLLSKQELDCITVHGRIYKQGFGGIANWDRIGDVASYVKVNSGFDKIVANGDILSVKEAKNLQKKHLLWGTMIGREFRAFLINESGKELANNEVTYNKIKKCLLKYLNYHQKYMQSYFSSEKSAYDSTKKILLILLKDFENMKRLKQELVLGTEYDFAIRSVEKYQLQS